MEANKDVKYLHAVEKRVLERMRDGQIRSGIFAPEKGLEDWGDNAMEEIADFINYMRMEQAELICLEEIEPVELEEMLEELRGMEQSAKILGVRLEAYHEKRWHGTEAQASRDKRITEKMKREKSDEIK